MLALHLCCVLCEAQHAHNLPADTGRADEVKTIQHSCHAVLCMLCLCILCCQCCVVHAGLCMLRQLCCACCAVLCFRLLCCTWYLVEQKGPIHCRAALHLIQLQHCRSLDEGIGVGNVNAILLGVKGCLIPHYLPSMEDPHVIIMSLANCTDLAKSH